MSIDPVPDQPPSLPRDPVERFRAVAALWDQQLAAEAGPYLRASNGAPAATAEERERLLARLERDLRALRSEGDRLRMQVERELAEVRQWKNRAEVAVLEGRDELACQALVRHGEHHEHARALAAELRIMEVATAECESVAASLGRIVSASPAAPVPPPDTSART